MNNGNVHEKSCVLSSRCNVAGSAKCNAQCSHFIALMGASGSGGRSAASGLPKDYKLTTLDNSPVAANQPKIYETLIKYASTFERQFEAGGERIKSLYLYSREPGTGKTTSAACLINEYIMTHYIGSLKRGRQVNQRPCFFLDTNHFQTTYNLATMTSNTGELEGIKSTIKKCMNVPFLVMDDIGLRNSSDSFKSIMHEIINKRTTESIPTIYTSNIPINELSTIFDHRLQDRVRDMCLEVSFGGESRRGKR